MKTPKILLASSSIYRRQLLQKLGLPFEWASPEINETPHQGETPTELTLRLAKHKAQHLAQKFPDHLIIGSDQVATLDEMIIGKPHNHANAADQLIRFRQREVKFATSVCLFNPNTNHTQASTEIYTVKFRNLTDTQIENYLRREQPYDCAGSFKSEGLGICLFEYLDGKDPNTLIGLPLIALTQMLANEGVDPLNQTSNFDQDNS